MLLPKFEYHEPSTLAESLQIMADLKAKARPLAGGTDLLVNMKKGLIAPENVVSLGRIDDLSKIDCSNGGMTIGACLTAADLAESEEVGKRCSALVKGASSLGSPLIRNRATIAGNVVTARPAADLPPCLMAYGADVVLRKSSGERTVSLDDFFQGPGETIIEADEILTEIVVQNQPPHSGGGYVKLGIRKTLEISLVNIAAFITLDKPDGTIQTARVVLGSVAPTPIRAPSAETVLVGGKPDEALLVKAGEAAAQDSKPIDDFRGSAEYRRDMVTVLTRRALNMALAEAQSS